MNRLTRVTLVVLAVAALSLAGCVSHPAATIRVLTYNIHHGEGMDGQIDLERIAQVIRQTEADLVALQEVDRGVERSNRVDQPARLGERTGLHAVFEKNIDCQGGEYGNAVLSRLPVERYQNHRLPKFLANEQRGLLEVHVRVAGQKLIFFATHLDHGPDDGERIASVAMLQELVGQRRDAPVIVAGDLNAVPDSRVIAETMVFLVGASAGGREFEITYPADKPDRLRAVQPAPRPEMCRFAGHTGAGRI